MFNKEMLLGSTQGQRKVKCTLGYYHSEYTGSVYGYRITKYTAYGSLDILPYWGTTSDVMTGLFRQQQRTYFEAPDGVTVFMEGYTHALSSGSSTELDVYRMYNLDGGKVRYLTFDPPRRLSGSRDARTDLGRGYYVEEVPLEAQDGEQGTSDDGWCRGVVDSTTQFHRGLLYRSNPVGLNRSDAYPLGRKSEHGYCNDSNTPKEYPTTYTKCRTLQGHNRRWVYSRRLRQTRNSNHSESKRGVSRGVLQSVTSKEALYA